MLGLGTQDFTMQRQSLHALANKAPTCGRVFATRTPVVRRRSPAFSSQLRSLPAHHGVCTPASVWPHVHLRRQRAAFIVTASSLVPEAIPSDVKLEVDEDTAAKEVTYDKATKTIKIPRTTINDGQRRTKMVMFTCNKCGGRSARLVNPVAWEKGAVFCQCQHCGVWHTLRAAKHIVEEIRYNDPDMDLGDLIEDVIFAIGAEPMEDGNGGEEDMQDAASDDSSQTELELPSDISEDQEDSSVTQDDIEGVAEAIAYNMAQTKSDSITQTDSYSAPQDKSYSAPQDNSYSAAHSSHSTTPTDSYNAPQDASSTTSHGSTYSAAQDSSHSTSHSSSYIAAHDHSSSSYDSSSSDSCGGGDSGGDCD